MSERMAQYLAGIGAKPSVLDGWTILEAYRAGVLVAMVITSGPEIHFVPIRGKGAMSRKNIRHHLAPIIEKYGYATTRVPLAETNHKLRLALGFKQTWSDATFSYWAITEMPYARKEKGETPCQ